MRDSFPYVPRARISDPRYRRELLAKVEALLSVLEVAHAKVLRNLALPGVDRSRLERVRLNLENTMEVCRRARRILVDGPPEMALPAPPTPSGRPQPQGGMSYREYLETSSYEEYRRLSDRGPIQDRELHDLDLDRLCQELVRWEDRPES